MFSLKRVLQVTPPLHQPIPLSLSLSLSLSYLLIPPNAYSSTPVGEVLSKSAFSHYQISTVSFKKLILSRSVRCFLFCLRHEEVSDFFASNCTGISRAETPFGQQLCFQITGHLHLVLDHPVLESLRLAIRILNFWSRPWGAPDSAPPIFRNGRENPPLPQPGHKFRNQKCASGR